jgi:hypothetical protein
MASIYINEPGLIIRLSVPDALTYFVVGGKRIYMSFHNYCGPTFYQDSDFKTEYVVEDEYHPIWKNFGKWYVKFEKARKERIKQIEEDSRNRRSRIHRDEPVQLSLELRARRNRDRCAPTRVIC